MRLGTIHSFQNPPGSGLANSAVYDAALEHVVRSEHAGYEWVNITEHHVTDDGYCPALMTVLGALAATTERIGLSTGMLILPLHHPIRIAEEAAVVDILSGGRLTLGVAAGYREIEFEVFAAEYKRRGTYLDEAIEVILKAWTGQSFAFSGEMISLPEIVVTPVPAQSPHPPIWVGGVSDRALARAVRLDAPFFPGATTTTDGVDRRFARFRELRAADRREGDPQFVLPRLAHVADTVEEARRVALPAIEAMFERYVRYGGPPELTTALHDWSVLDQYVIVGDERRCRDRLEQCAQMGVTDLMLQFAMPTIDPERALEAMERIAFVAGKDEQQAAVSR